jgi:hypothetical protein
MSRVTVDAYAIRFHELHHTCASIMDVQAWSPNTHSSAWATQTSP